MERRENLSVVSPSSNDLSTRTNVGKKVLTYKKTGGARRSRKDKTQRRKQSAGSRKNRKSKNLRRKQSGQGTPEEDQKKEARDLFNMYAKKKPEEGSNEGRMSFNEFKQMMTDQGNSDNAEDFFLNLATISYDAYLQQALGDVESITPEEEIRQVYDVLERKGPVTSEDFKVAAQEFNKDIKDLDLNVILKDLSEEEKKNISLENFQKMINKVKGINSEI